MRLPAILALGALVLPASAELTVTSDTSTANGAAGWSIDHEVVSQNVTTSANNGGNLDVWTMVTSGPATGILVGSGSFADNLWSLGRVTSSAGGGVAGVMMWETSVDIDALGGIDELNATFTGRDGTSATDTAHLVVRQGGTHYFSSTVLHFGGAFATNTLTGLTPADFMEVTGFDSFGAVLTAPATGLDFSTGTAVFGLGNVYGFGASVINKDWGFFTEQLEITLNSGAPGANVVIDGSLDDGDWAGHTFPMENISALIADQASVGAPATALNLSNTSTGGTNYTYAVVHEYTGGSYDPGASGAIASLDWSITLSSYNNAPFFPALVQGGTVYKRVGNHNTDYAGTGTFDELIDDPASWEEINPNATSSSNLSLAGNNPDFSPDGAPITFGVMQWFGATSGTNGTDVLRDMDITAFSVELNETPPPPGTEITIVALGDSTTAPRSVGAALNGRPVGNSTRGLNDGSNSVSVVTETSSYLYVYADGLRDALGNAIGHAPGDTPPPAEECQPPVVDNEGIGGNRTDQALTRLNSDVRTKNPEVVVIQFGINDSAHDSGPATPSRVPLDFAEQYGPDGQPGGGDDHVNAARGNYEDNLTSIVQTLETDGARVVLMTPNRVVDYTAVSEARLTLYAQIVRDVAVAEGVELVDVWQLYTDYMAEPGQDKTDLLLDGVHPNGDGQALLVDALTPLMIDEMEKGYDCWTTVCGIDPGMAGPSDTPFGDGVENLLRWAFEIECVAGASLANLPQAATASDMGTDYFEMTYPLRDGMHGTATPQYSTTLAAGNWINAMHGAPLNGGTISIVEAAGIVTVRLPIGSAASMFGRVEVTQN